ncbi:MAG TPA: ABATE domain-containing protein [Ktedonosporobacter sp.]|nr:ABATE domain-containing protein [Ktedonosporobacter sp.]
MNEIELETRPTPVFDISGGHLCLDFANTLDNRMGEKPQELLSRYSDLVAWGEQTRIVSNEEARQLLEAAAKHPNDAIAVLEHVRTVREALYRILEKSVEDIAPEKSDLLILDETLAQGMSRAHLMTEENGFSWGWVAKGEELESVLWVVARSAAELLTSELRHDVRLCAADDCGWLFLDTSKNHSRRWCNMKSCGNRAKARRYIERKR